MKSKVYFTKDLTKESLVKIYQKLGIKLEGNVAIKVHSGESGNQNFLHPEYFKDIIDYVGGTVIECNTAYDGERNTTEKHKKLLDNPSPEFKKRIEYLLNEYYSSVTQYIQSQIKFNENKKIEFRRTNVIYSFFCFIELE